MPWTCEKAGGQKLPILRWIKNMKERYQSVNTGIFLEERFLPSGMSFAILGLQKNTVLGRRENE